MTTHFEITFEFECDNSSLTILNDCFPVSIRFSSKNNLKIGILYQNIKLNKISKSDVNLNKNSYKLHFKKNEILLFMRIQVKTLLL